MAKEMERITLNAIELAACLGVSRATAYNLLHAKDFPAFTIGKRRLVTKVAFERWLEEQQCKNI